MELQRKECIDMYNALQELEIRELSNGQITKKNYFDGETTFKIIHNRRELKKIVDEVTETHNEMVKQHSTEESPNMVSPNRIADFNDVLNNYRNESITVQLKKIDYNKLHIVFGDDAKNTNVFSVSAIEGIVPLLDNVPQ